MIINRDSSGSHSISTAALQPAWSPDGQRLAVALGNPNTVAGTDIGVINQDGSGAVNLTNDPT
jgi:Tol biopolymer transport system component